MAGFLPQERQQLANRLIPLVTAVFDVLEFHDAPKFRRQRAGFLAEFKTIDAEQER